MSTRICFRASSTNCVFGIDELLTYHYLVAETFRSTRITPDKFWSIPKTDQADLVWKTLFVDNTPTSEAAQGIISVLDIFGLDTRAEDLKEAREFFNSQGLAEHIDQVFDIARVSGVVMTNDPLDEKELEVWNGGFTADSRFKSSLRLDRLLDSVASRSTASMRQLLDEWIQRLNPVYWLFRYHLSSNTRVMTTARGCCVALADRQRARPCFDYDGWRPARKPKISRSR